MSLLINKYWISTQYIEFNLFEKNVVILFVMDINKINYFAYNINCFASISPTHICYTLCAKFLLFTLLNNLIMRSWRGRMVVGWRLLGKVPESLSGYSPPTFFCDFFFPFLYYLEISPRFSFFLWLHFLMLYFISRP